MNDNARFSRPRSSLTNAIVLCVLLCAVGCGKREDNRAADAPLSGNEQSKPTDRSAAVERVAVSEKGKQVPVKIDWGSLTYLGRGDFNNGAYTGHFNTRDRSSITVALSATFDVAPSEDPEVSVGINLPEIDLQQSPQLQQRLLKAIDRLIQKAKTDGARDQLTKLKKEVLSRSKPTSGKVVAEHVAEDERQLSVRIDWDSLKLGRKFELARGGSTYVFPLPDDYELCVDDKPPHDTLWLVIRLPTIDVSRSPQLKQSMVKAIDRLIEEAENDTSKNELTYLKKDVLRRSKPK